MIEGTFEMHFDAEDLAGVSDFRYPIGRMNFDVALRMVLRYAPPGLIPNWWRARAQRRFDLHSNVRKQKRYRELQRRLLR